MSPGLVVLGRAVAPALPDFVLQAITTWNPVSAVVAGTRVLWGNPNPSGTIQAWPMQHPVAAALTWSG